MDGTRQLITLSKLCLTFALAAVVAACASGDDVDEVSVLPDFTDIRLTGSVGDGPIVGASMTVISKDGTVLAEFESTGDAGYDVTIRTRPRNYPLTVEAVGGIDLVTDMAPDFTLRALVVAPAKRAVTNINPYSTIALTLAGQLEGGVNRKNLARAESIVVTRLNFGLDSLLDSGPLSTKIDDGNVAEIVRASEALGELIRRSRDALTAAGVATTGDEVLEAIGSDLTDEVLDGQGGPGADPRIAAVASIAAAQIALETMANELHVNAVDGTAAMTAAIRQVAGAGSQSLAELSSTAQMLFQARIGLAAAAGATGDAGIESLLDDALALQAGLDASTVRSLLPAGYRTRLDGALATAAGGDTATVTAVNDMVRAGDPDPGINQAPTINGSPAVEVQAGSPYSFLPTVFDPDGDPLVFTGSRVPAWASLDTATGELSGTPDESDVGDYSRISITVSDGVASASFGPFAISVTPPPVSNNPPTISGSAPSNAQVGTAYAFTPVAADADGDTLVFSVANRPSWAAFNESSGRLSGTPGAADVGSYNGIAITVSDGSESAVLGPFSITVNAISNGQVTLNWMPPTQNTDGSPLTDLAGYKIYWGRNGEFSNTVAIDNPGITIYVVENLSSGSWEFASSAYNAQGVESDLSNVVVRQVP